MFEFYYTVLIDYVIRFSVFTCVFLLIIHLIGLLYQYSMANEFTNDALVNDDTWQGFVNYLRRILNPHTNVEPLVLFFIIILGFAIPIIYFALPILIFVIPLLIWIDRVRDKNLKIKNAVDIISGETEWDGT